jgi:hypothetical protein
MDKNTKTEIEAAVFRRLIKHFQHRTDVQNIDLMGQSGFCRNCLSKWYLAAAEDIGGTISKDLSLEAIYGMPYGEFKEKHQTPASAEQLALMDESILKNNH